MLLEILDVSVGHHLWDKANVMKGVFACLMVVTLFPELVCLLSKTIHDPRDLTKYSESYRISRNMWFSMILVGSGRSELGLECRCAYGGGHTERMRVVAKGVWIGSTGPLEVKAAPFEEYEEHSLSSEIPMRIQGRKHLQKPCDKV